MKICDLHAHTYFSDGTFSPTELVCEAKRVGLSAVALTDHNNLGGAKEFLSAIKDTGIEPVVGVEFSTDYGEKELHILGLFIDEKHFAAVDKMAQRVRDNKEKSNREMIDKLKNAGYDLDYDEISKRCSGTMNRAHIGEELCVKGYTSTVEEVFSTILAKNGKFYVPAKRIDTFEAIEFIKSIGAVAVLAHPFLDLNEDELRIFLTQAVKFGLDGMETVYTTYSDEQTVLAKSIAKQFGLKESGGSDFHGYRKKGVELATGRGNLIIPYSFYENLKPKGN